MGSWIHGTWSCVSLIGKVTFDSGSISSLVVGVSLSVVDEHEIKKTKRQSIIFFMSLILVKLTI